MDVCQKKQEHLQPDDPRDVGDAWIWRAIALPSHLRVVNHLSHDRSKREATRFLAAFKARTDGRSPLFTSDKLPAYVSALTANYSTVERPSAQRGRSHNKPRSILESELQYAQIDKHRKDGRVVEGRRRVIFGSAEAIHQLLGDQHINTSYVERDHLTSRHSNGRLVRQTLSYTKKDYYLQRHLDLEDAVFNFVRAHHSLRVAVRHPVNGRKWQQRSPAMVAGLTDHIWTLEDLLSHRLPPARD